MRCKSLTVSIIEVISSYLDINRRSRPTYALLKVHLFTLSTCVCCRGSVAIFSKFHVSMPSSYASLLTSTLHGLPSAWNMFIDHLQWETKGVIWQKVLVVLRRSSNNSLTVSMSSKVPVLDKRINSMYILYFKHIPLIPKSNRKESLS
jgi:hypothetical protein